MQDQRQTTARAIITPLPKGMWQLASRNPTEERCVQFWAHVHFLEDKEWPDRSWTLWVDLDAPFDPSEESVTATVHFASSEAPHHLLRTEALFDLYIGTIRRIASGRVIAETGDVS